MYKFIELQFIELHQDVVRINSDINRGILIILGVLTHFSQFC